MSGADSIAARRWQILARHVDPPGVGNTRNGGPATAFRPPHRPRTVRRNGVLAILAAVPDDVPLVLVTAPAGYGKTTVLRQWAHEERRLVGWIHGGESGGDLVRLLRDVAAALHLVRPMDYLVGREVGSASDAERGLRGLLIAAWAGAPWVLVIDDAHRLRASVVQALVNVVAEGLPPGCRVVLAGRHRNGLRLGSLRSRGTCVEIGTRELALTAGEAAAFLSLAGHHPTAAALDDLLHRAEGWPAGIYLVGLSTGSEPHPGGAGATEWATTHVYDYLREEVLRRESPEMVRFLLHTAPLTELSGPLCDTVLGSTGSAARLADLERRQVFLQPTGAGRAWFRYHRLFREMLLEELGRRDPGAAARIHRRAAGWHDARGEAVPAVRHALAGADLAMTAGLVARHAPGQLDAGRLYQVRGWVRRLDDDALGDHPALAVVAGLVWALTGVTGRALDCLHIAERAAFAGAADRPGPPTSDRDRGLVAAIAQLRAALAPLGVGHMLIDAELAADLNPPGSTWHPTAAMLLGVARLLNGDRDAAAATLERAVRLGRDGQRSPASLALAQLSLLAAEQEDWPVAEAYAAEARELVETGQLGDYVSSIPAYVASARVALHHRRIELAQHHVREATRLYTEPGPAAFPWLAVQMAVAIGQILLDLDELPAARQKVSEAQRHLAAWPTDGLLAAQHRRLAHDLIERSDRTRGTSGTALTAAELRVLQLLPTHLTLGEIADALFISRNTVKTQVASIYGKLLASSRTEAVSAARDLGLLD